MWSEIRKAGHWEVAVTLGLIRWLSQFDDSVRFAWWNNHLPKNKIHLFLYVLMGCVSAPWRPCRGQRTAAGVTSFLLPCGSWALNPHLCPITSSCWAFLAGPEYDFGCCCSGIYFCLFPCPPIYVIDIWVGAVCDRVSVGAGSIAQHSETRGQLWVLVLPPTLSEAGFLCKLCWLMNVWGLSSLHLSPLFRTTCITDMQDTVFGFMRVLEIQPRVLLLHCKCFIH